MLALDRHGGGVDALFDLGDFVDSSFVASAVEGGVDPDLDDFIHQAGAQEIR